MRNRNDDFEEGSNELLVLIYDKMGLFKLMDKIVHVINKIKH